MDLVQSLVLLPDQVWSEQNLGSPEPGRTNIKTGTIRKRVLNSLRLHCFLFRRIASKEQALSLIVLTISNSAVVLKLTPSFLSNSLRYLVTSLPATSTLMMLWGMANPSYMGTA